MSRVTWQQFSSFLVIAVSACLPPAASALDIQFNYRGPNTSSPHSQATEHAFIKDFSGSILMAHAEQAARDWERVIEDDHVILIDVFYAPESYVGDTPASIDPSFVYETLSNGKRRTLHGEIRVNDILDAYYDPDPTDSSEFGMPAQTLLGPPRDGDFSNYTEKGINHDGGDPSLLEIRYTNSYLGAGASGNKFDFLTILRHEIGHLVGLNQRSTADQADGDFDVDPNLINSAKFGIVGGGHLENEFPLMGQANSGAGYRDEISAMDLLAAQAGSGWQQINLERLDYLGPRAGSSTSANVNWTGNRQPDPTDYIAVRNGSVAVVTSDQVVGGLLVNLDSLLSVSAGRRLLVDGSAVIGGAASDQSGNVALGLGAELSVEDLDLRRGTLSLNSATLKSRLGDINNEGTISGHGTINIAGTFVNDGELVVTQNVLNINGPFLANPVADLDGTSNGNGVVDATNGSLDVQISNADSFNGTMTIGAGQFVRLPDSWNLRGRLNLNGTSSQPASLRGGDLELTGDIEVDGHARIEVPMEATGNVVVSITNVPGANDRLTFSQPVTYRGTKLTGDGTFIYEQDLTIENLRSDVGAIEIGPASEVEINGGRLYADNIQHDGSSFVMNGGQLRFEKFTGDATNHAGTLVVEQALFDGLYIQEESATMQIEIGGIGPGESSRLTSTEAVLLAGMIEVDLDFGYTPTVGEQFLVVSSPELVITDSLTLVGSAASHFELVIEDQSLILEAILAGDYNHDGLVDAADYTVWRDGDSPDNSEAGYDIWANNYGATAAIAISQTTSSAVPEPAAAVSLLLACLGTLVRRRVS